MAKRRRMLVSILIGLLPALFIRFDSVVMGYMEGRQQVKTSQLIWKILWIFCVPIMVRFATTVYIMTKREALHFLLHMNFRPRTWRCIWQQETRVIQIMMYIGSMGEFASIRSQRPGSRLL